MEHSAKLEISSNTPSLASGIKSLTNIAEARHQTDHIFMNWWVGTFIVNFFTLGLYTTYRFTRSLHRRNQHIKRTVAFYKTLPEVISALPQAQTYRKVIEEPLDELVYRFESIEIKQQLKPLNWKLYSGLCLFYLALVVIGVSIGLLSGKDPEELQSTSKMVFKLYEELGSLLWTFNFIYWFYLMKRLMDDYVYLDELEKTIVGCVQAVLKTLSGGDNRFRMAFEPQCEPRNFWAHLGFGLFGFWLNFIYVDYCQITETQRRFKESARTQLTIVKLIKELANNQPKPIESPEEW